MDAKSNNFSNKISFQICENTLIGKTIVELNDESDQGCSRVFETLIKTLPYNNLSFKYNGSPSKNPDIKMPLVVIFLQ